MLKSDKMVPLVGQARRISNGIPMINWIGSSKERVEHLCQRAIQFIQQKRNAGDTPQFATDTGNNEKSSPVKQTNTRKVVYEVPMHVTIRRCSIVGGTWFTGLALLCTGASAGIGAANPWLPVLIATPYIVRQQYLWMVDKPSQIVCATEKQQCTASYIGIPNKVSFSKADLIRVPNPVCTYNAEPIRRGVIEWVQSIYRPRADPNTITVYPGNIWKERKFILNPDLLVKTPSVYSYFFCVDTLCKDTNIDAVQCDANPNPKAVVKPADATSEKSDGESSGVALVKSDSTPSAKLPAA